MGRGAFARPGEAIVEGAPRAARPSFHNAYFR